VRSDAQTIAKALEVPIEVQDLDPGILGGGGHRQIGEGNRWAP
jgi:hypothetical protein